MKRKFVIIAITFIIAVLISWGGELLTTHALDKEIVSKGIIRVSDDILFDATDFDRLEEAIETGKEATRLATIEEVQASPKDFGITTTLSGIDSVKGIFGSTNVGNSAMVTIPVGYDFAIITYTNGPITRYIGTPIASTNNNSGTILAPLNGESVTFQIYGNWGCGAAVVAVKMKQGS